jgi:hypothetical protein
METFNFSETSVNIYQTTRGPWEKRAVLNFCWLSRVPPGWLLDVGVCRQPDSTWKRNGPLTCHCYHAEWVALLLRIREVLCSNIGLESGKKSSSCCLIHTGVLFGLLFNREGIPPKRPLPFSGPHGIIYSKIKVLNYYNRNYAYFVFEILQFYSCLYHFLSIINRSWTRLYGITFQKVVLFISDIHKCDLFVLI